MCENIPAADFIGCESGDPSQFPRRAERTLDKLGAKLPRDSWSRLCAASLVWTRAVKTIPLSRVKSASVGYRMSLLSSYEDYEEGVFSDPVLLYSEGEPRILDTIFNVSSLTTSGIFNNTLFQTAGIIILGIILFGEFNETTNQVFTFSTTCGKGQVGASLGTRTRVHLLLLNISSGSQKYK